MQMVDYEKLNKSVSEIFKKDIKIILLEGIADDHVIIGGEKIYPVNGKYTVPLHDPSIPDDLPTYIYKEISIGKYYMPVEEAKNYILKF